MYGTWIAVLVIGCLKNHGKIFVDTFSNRFIIAYMLFCAYCLFTGVLDSRHFSAHYIRVLIVPLIMTVAGCMYSDMEKTLLNIIGRVYLICSVLFGFWMQKNFFLSYTTWLSTKIYLFQQKNSAGQIWVAAIFVSILLLEYRNNLERVLIYIACGYLLVLTGICQCRTALLGVAVAVIAFTILRAKHKRRWILLITASALAVWFMPETHRFIEQALVLNKYVGADLNTFSSGRIDRYEQAFRSIISAPFIGVGRYYVDCSYLLIIAESGLIGFAMIEGIWLKKISMCFHYYEETQKSAFLFMMTIFYIIESVLEGYPPFGPGVSSFMYWFLSSVMLNQEQIIEDDSRICFDR